MRNVLNARAYPGMDCSSDHNLMGIKCRLRIRANRKVNAVTRVDLRALANVQTKASFAVGVKNRFDSLPEFVEKQPPEEL